MTEDHSFLLDENTVAGAFRRKRIAELWVHIAANCHRIVVSHELSEKYWAKIRLRRRQREHDQMTSILSRYISLLMHDSAKSAWVAPNEVAIRERVVRHRNDWFLEDIATSLPGQFPDLDHCFFVSTDRATRDDFNHRKLRALGFSGLRIEEGLERAMETRTEAGAEKTISRPSPGLPSTSFPIS